MSYPHLEAPERPDLARLYQAALDTLLDVDVVDRGDGPVITAGGGYASPWTRDASINSMAAGSLLVPDVARRTLLSVCETEADGTTLVAQDDQWWDQIIWAVGAWHHVIVTGDRDFLVRAYPIAAATAARLEAARFDPRHRLYRGPAVMQDGISGYPAPPADPANPSSFVLDHAGAEDVMCLSTNALYVAARRAIAAMATALGEDGSHHLEAAAELSAVSQERFWDEEAGTYRYLIHGPGPDEGRLEPYQEALGLALMLRLDLVPASRQPRLLAAVTKEPVGIANVAPAFARYDADHPGRHNLACWPMVMAAWADALAHVGDVNGFASALEDLRRLFAGSDDHFYEVYHPATGAVDGGWQSGRQWESQPDQTWSAATWLGLVHHRLLGLRLGVDGIRVRPVVPEGWGPLTLRDLRYRDVVLDVTVTGRGRQVTSVTVDGDAVGGELALGADSTGRHEVVVRLS
jgi:glycogen debranching enzyme